MRMTQEKAREVLGLTPYTVLSTACIDGAFRMYVRTYHPDTAVRAMQDGPPTPDTPTIDLLREARDTLRRVVAGTNNPCAQCNGKGRVPFGMGTAQCGACKGTGDRTP